VTIVAENLILVAIGGRFKPYPSALFSAKPIKMFGVVVGIVDLEIVIISVITLIAVELYIKYSRDGLAIRSASFSLDITSLMGVNVDKLIMTVFIIAGLLAGVAGYFMGIKYTAYPTLDQLSIKAFISAVLGGMGSLTGSVVGAFILGISEVMVTGYISSSLRDVFTFSLLVIILLVRPTGIMGKSSEDKV
jgi:branched-chain amino acid transport system permease protein